MRTYSLQQHIANSTYRRTPLIPIITLFGGLVCSGFMNTTYAADAAPQETQATWQIDMSDSVSDAGDGASKE